ncbi:MAG: hypothetical protein IT326_06475, partial [Anaerolineae bacterium]|nr:hypothetical protein [Anaerolineae bacterium]
LAQWMSNFGLAQRTGIELAGEVEGTLPTPDWKRQVWGENWSTGDTYNSAFGQGYVLVTPLQMLNMTNIIANDGVPPRPTLIRRITDAQGNVVQDLVPDYGDPLPISPENMDIIQQGMREAVINPEGTARFALNYIDYVPVAGKTGTAEYCDNIAAALERCIPGAWPAHAWYVTYAPYANPEISVVAFIYNGQEGATVALPVASSLLNTYFTLKAERALAASEGTPQPAPAPGPTPTQIEGMQ